MGYKTVFILALLERYHETDVCLIRKGNSWTNPLISYEYDRMQT